MKKNLFLILFLFSVVGVFAGIVFHLKWLDYVFKPLIMISVSGYFLIRAAGIASKIVKTAILAFVFSLFGDVFMMLTDKGEIYFLLGLFFFLIAQFFYIFLFWLSVQVENGIPFLKKNYTYLVFYIFYGGFIFFILFPKLETTLKTAVFVYIIAISAMSVMALNRYRVVNYLSFVLVYVGSLLFIISDTLIALNSFYEAIPYHRIYIMSTYISAQFLIMKGILKQFEP